MIYIGKVLQEFPKRTVFRSLLNKVEKDIFIAQFGQYQGSGSFFKFFRLFSANIKTSSVIPPVT